MRQSHLIVQTFKYTNIIILMVMELKMATRKFNGETLHLVGNPVSTKSEAQKIAKTYRKLGYLARVVDLDYGYGVFSLYVIHIRLVLLSFKYIYKYYMCVLLYISISM